MPVSMPEESLDGIFSTILAIDGVPARFPPTSFAVFSSFLFTLRLTNAHSIGTAEPSAIERENDRTMQFCRLLHMACFPDLSSGKRFFVRPIRSRSLFSLRKNKTDAKMEETKTFRFLKNGCNLTKFLERSI